MSLDPLAPQPARPPLAAGEKGAIAVVFVCFLIWLPVYLFFVRPIINRFLATYITHYPAMLHLIPIIVVPVVIGFMLAWFLKKRASDNAL